VSEPEVVVRAVELTKSYRRGAEEVRALKGVSLEIRAGELLAIVGPSGSGKTTLLNLMGCLDVPTSGSLSIGGHPLQGLSEGKLTRLRREQVGFVFQHFGLLPTLTVAENVALPAFLARRTATERVADLLRTVGLEHRKDHRPHELSGGEMQRVAIARALVNHPPLVLCDEPTGNLDTENSLAVYELLRRLNRENRQTIVVVTHDPQLAAKTDRIVRLVDGRVESDTAVG
jgi:putative ABC transport system ATP-binding protein